ncbi:MAG TPA: O-antigen ligase family protein [Terrimicrobiaceae bacterium]
MPPSFRLRSLQPEYYYYEALRWSFGFENPNNAAVIFACLLPIFWTLWMLSWRLKPEGFRRAALFACAALILADAYCLFLTYSRGGAVAAAGGLVYLLARVAWKRRPWNPSQILHSRHLYFTIALLGCFVGLFFSLGVGARSLESASDMSVRNRITLWGYALQMVVDNPAGFGTGKSGDAYMQWYEPLEMTAGYRTMVNSYLTYLVEQGWLPFALLLLGVSLFWFWASPRHPSVSSFEVETGLRATIVTFLISGLFSTVMEERLLWVIPSLCAGLLLVWNLAEGTRITGKVLLAGGATTAVVCLMLFITGLSRSDEFVRQFYRGKDGAAIAAIHSSENKSAEWVVAPDARILGRAFGKLLRRLCRETGIGLRFYPPSLEGDENVILVGDCTEVGLRNIPVKLVLLAPKSLREDQMQRLLAGNVLLLLPEVDEDGRTECWRDVARNVEHDKIKLVELEGVGLQADWAWDQVVEAIKQF